jgi:hypothetical protein
VAPHRLPDPPTNLPYCFTDLLDLRELLFSSKHLQSLWGVTHKKADKRNQRQLTPFTCPTQRSMINKSNTLQQCALRYSSDGQCTLGALSYSVAERSG